MIQFSESFKKFLEENKERSKVVNSLYQYVKKPYIKAYRLMINEEEINYITFRNNGMISYMPKGKEQLINDDGTWKKEGRQEGKPAKVIRKLFTDKAVKLFKESGLDCFNNIYKSYFNTELELTSLDRLSIKEVYKMDRRDGGGSLNSSCMNGDSEYLDIYENCESLRILILKDKDGLLCGRALVWNIGELTLMDRVYVSDDYMFQMFFDYAQKNNMIRKYQQSWYNKSNWLKPNGEKFKEYFKIYTDTDWSKYPYIDTFSYGDNGFLTNESGFTYEYNETNGGRQGGEDEHEGEVCDEIDGNYIDKDDSVMIEAGRYEGYITHYSNTVTTVDGVVYWVDSNEIVRLYNDDIVEIDDATCCDKTGNWYLSDDCHFVDCGEYENMCTHKDYVIIDVNGNSWYIDDSDITLINGEYYPIDSELITLVDGEYCLIENLEIA